MVQPLPPVVPVVPVVVELVVPVVVPVVVVLVPVVDVLVVPVVVDVPVVVPVVEVAVVAVVQVAVAPQWLLRSQKVFEAYASHSREGSNGVVIAVSPLAMLHLRRSVAWYVLTPLADQAVPGLVPSPMTSTSAPAAVVSSRVSLPLKPKTALPVPEATRSQWAEGSIPEAHTTKLAPRARLPASAKVFVDVPPFTSSTMRNWERSMGSSALSLVSSSALLLAVPSTYSEKKRPDPLLPVVVLPVVVLSVVVVVPVVVLDELPTLLVVLPAPVVVVVLPVVELELAVLPVLLELDEPTLVVLLEPVVEVVDPTLLAPVDEVVLPLLVAPEVSDAPVLVDELELPVVLVDALALPFAVPEVVCEVVVPGRPVDELAVAVVSPEPHASEPLATRTSAAKSWGRAIPRVMGMARV